MCTRLQEREIVSRIGLRSQDHNCELALRSSLESSGHRIAIARSLSSKGVKSSAGRNGLLRRPALRWPLPGDVLLPGHSQIASHELALRNLKECHIRQVTKGEVFDHKSNSWLDPARSDVACLLNVWNFRSWLYPSLSLQRKAYFGVCNIVSKSTRLTRSCTVQTSKLAVLSLSLTFGELSE